MEREKWAEKKKKKEKTKENKIKKEKKKKNHITCWKGNAEGAITAAANWEKEKRKKKKHRLAFLFTLKNPSATWKLQFSISAELHYWASEWLKRHNIMGQIHTTDLLLQMISTSLIISPEMFSFDTGCNESYDVAKSRQRGFRRVLSFLRQSMTYKNNISPPLQFREFLYLMSFIILEIK